jgi:K+-sensing histidine kinase KdpD
MKENAARIKKRILAFRLGWRPMVETLLIMLAATALSFVLHEFFIQNNNVSMIYALAVVVVSCITPGYF